VEDLTYSGTKFCKDLDMPLPEGEDFDDGGKNKQILIFNVFYCF